MPAQSATPSDIVAWAATRFGDGLVMTSSFGAEAALTLHWVTQIVPNIRVVFLDTGYLFAETYQFAELLTKRFKLNVVVCNPNITAARQEALHGKMWRGSENDLAQYNYLNKVEPLDRALFELNATAWISGVRANQNSTRSAMRPVEEALLYADEPTKKRTLYKVHPMLGLTQDDVDAYMELHNLPYHPLVAFGYHSIGDTHSTEPTAEGEDPRDGRHLGAKKECGIHLPRDPQLAKSLRSSGL